MKIRQVIKVLIPAISACLLPLPAINNIVTTTNDQPRIVEGGQATSNLYYGTSTLNDQQSTDENVTVINDFTGNFIPTPEKLDFTKHDPINPDDPEDLGYYSVMLKPYMEGDVIIPETYKGLPVTQIDKVTSNNFSESLSSNVETIVIPSSITYINKSAFYNSTVKNIVFQGESSPTFADGAFCSIHHLENIVAPDNYLNNYIEVFSDSRILNCSSLENVNYLPLSALTPLEYLPLVDQRSTETKAYSVKLPEKISNQMLSGVVIIPDEYNGLPVVKLEDGMFANQSEITDIQLPKNLEVVGNNCFYNTKKLESIALPSTVKEIGSQAFASSTNSFPGDKKEIYFNNQECILEKVDSTSFEGVENIYTPYDYESLETTQKTLFKYINSNCFPSSTEGKIHVKPTLDKYQLKDYHQNNNGTYYDGLMVAPNNEFSSNIKVNGPIIIPNVYDGLAVNAIVENCFANYGNVPYIYFDDSYDLKHNPTSADEALKIGKNAFNNEAIRDIKLPRKNDYELRESWNSKNSCSQDEIFGTNLNAIYVDDRLSNWTYYFESYDSLIATFSNYENITMEFTAHQTIDQQNLLEFELSSDQTSYSVSLNTRNANINNAKVIEIPSQHNGLPVVEIAPYAFARNYDDQFSNDNKISTIIIPDSIVKIGAHAFENCKFLQKIEFAQEGSLMIIDDYAFNGCDNIKSLEIPGTITSLSQTSFDNMMGLETITFNGMDEDSFKSESSAPSFNACKNLKTIYVPYIYNHGNDFKSYFIDNQNKVKIIPSYEYYDFELIEEEVEDVTVTNIDTGEEEPYIDTYYKITPNTKLEEDRNIISELNFPTAINGIPVKKIDGDFNNLHNLKAIYIGKNIEYLGNEDADGNSKNFRYCENLESIKVDCENINFMMLYGTSNTSGCLIQGSEVDIDCSNIVTAIGQVDLYGDIYNIAEQAFKGCSSMTELSIYNQSLETKEKLGLSAKCTLGDFLNVMYSEDDLKALEDEINSEDSDDLDFTFDEMMNYDMRFTVYDEAFYDCTNLSRINFFSSEIPEVKRHNHNASTIGLEIIFNNTYPVNWQNAYPDCYFYSLIDSGEEIASMQLTYRGGAPDPSSEYSVWYHAAKDSNGLRSSWVDGSDWAIHETLYRLRDHYEWFVQSIIANLQVSDPELADALNRLLYLDPEHAGDILNLVFECINIIITIVSTVLTVCAIAELTSIGISKVSKNIKKLKKPKKHGKKVLTGEVVNAVYLDDAFGARVELNTHILREDGSTFDQFFETIYFKKDMKKNHKHWNISSKKIIKRIDKALMNRVRIGQIDGYKYNGSLKFFFDKLI